MNVHRIVALLAALALCLSPALVACGGDDDSGGGGSSDKPAAQPALSKQDYIDQLNKAQTDFAAEAAKLDLASPSSPKDFKNSLDKLVVSIDGLVADMKDLEPPASVSTLHDKLVAGLEKYKRLIQDQKGALTSEDPSDVRDAALKIAHGSETFSTNFSKTISDINAKLKS